MADGVQIKLDGVDELKRALEALPAAIRTKAVRGALTAAGRVIQKQARINAPVLKSSTATRTAGTVRKAISVRRSRQRTRNADEGVFVGVRPLRGSRQNKLGRAGASNPNDPYYWWWVEFGTKPHTIKAKRKKLLRVGTGYAKSVQHPGIKGQRFMTRAAEQKGNEAIQTFMRQVVPQIERLNKRGLK